MERRAFLNWVGVGCLASFLPVAIAACGDNSAADSTTDAPAAPRAAEGGPVTVGTVAELGAAGSILAENTAVGPVLVIADPNQANGVIAVNPTCTHAGCTVEWQADQDLFVCPCHNSQFGPTGDVVNGPATEPLPTYTAQVEGEQILVQGS